MDNLTMCLGKTLKTEIKFIAKVKMSYVYESGKDPNTTTDGNSQSNRNTHILCLGKDKIFIINETMENIFEKIQYELVNQIIINCKTNENFWLDIKPNTIMKNPIIKFSIFSEYRALIIKNLMCYYSVYYMSQYSDIRNLPYSKKFEIPPKVVEESEGPKQTIKIKTISWKNYVFYYNGYIKDQSKITDVNIKYDQTQLVNGKKLITNENLPKECNFTFEISDPIPIHNFEANKDDRDLSEYAIKHFLLYMKNILKVNRYWVTKNKIFNKKSNLNGDECIWDGWTIEARIWDPYYKNIIFVYLRRKFLPPMFDTYQNFLFILNEICTPQLYEINPLANMLIDTISSSLHSIVLSSCRDADLLLKAKVDSLLVDEESLYYYQFGYKIIGTDVHSFGFNLLWNIFRYCEELSGKEKIDSFKSFLTTKRKFYEVDSFDKWNITEKNFKFLDKLKEFIDANFKNNEEEVKENQTGMIDETPTDSAADEIKKQKIKQIKRSWKMKVLRFITFCINGALTDYAVNYETFINDIVNKTLSGNNDIKELFFQTMFIMESDCFDDLSSADKIASLGDSSPIIFNEDALAFAIKTGFLSRYLSENVAACPKIINLLLSQYPTNKILSSVLTYLKSMTNLSDENIISDERKAYMNIIPSLLKIFSDTNKSPITLMLCCKCLCCIVSKKCDEVFRKKIIYELDTVRYLSKYLEMYDYDEKFVLCCLDLFIYLMNEVELNIVEYLYASDSNLFVNLKKFVEPTGISGTYYSQRIIIKVLTIFLNLTNRIEAGVKSMINSTYTSLFSIFLRLVDDNKRNEVIDPNEEESTILEFKTYWLLCILTFKNQIAKDHFKSINIFDFIESKSRKFSNVIDLIIQFKGKGGYSEKKVEAISKNIVKFFEFVYYLILENTDDIFELKNRRKHFTALKVKIDENKNYLVLIEVEVFNWIEKLYKKMENDF